MASGEVTAYTLWDQLLLKRGVRWLLDLLGPPPIIISLGPGTMT